MGGLYQNDGLVHRKNGQSVVVISKVQMTTINMKVLSIPTICCNMSIATNDKRFQKYIGMLANQGFLTTAYLKEKNDNHGWNGEENIYVTFYNLNNFALSSFKEAHLPSLLKNASQTFVWQCLHQNDITND